MSGESFQRRVAFLRDTWAERRHLKRVAGATDFESQFTLLELLYGWAETAASDVRAVYRNELPVTLTPPPLANGLQVFSVTVGHNYTVTFALTRRQRAGGTTWTIVVTLGADGANTAAGPERRNGQWTRARLEDLLLLLLGAYERAASGGAKSAADGFGGRSAM